MGNSQRRPKGRHRPKSATGTLSLSVSRFHLVCPSVSDRSASLLSPRSPSHITPPVHPYIRVCCLCTSHIQVCTHHSFTRLCICSHVGLVLLCSPSPEVPHVYGSHIHPSLFPFHPFHTHMHSLGCIYLSLCCCCAPSVVCVHASPTFLHPKLSRAHVPLFSPLH